MPCRLCLWLSQWVLRHLPPWLLKWLSRRLPGCLPHLSAAPAPTACV
jgi:hypothetical protein